MRKIVILFFILFLVTAASGEVQYSIGVDEYSVAMNSTVELDCDRTCPGLTWLLPEDAEVLGVRDGRGEIDGYTVSGGEVSIPGRRSYGSDDRVIEIRTVIDSDAEEIHEGLYKRGPLRLSGFEGERTTGTVKAEDLLSGRTGFGFDMSFSGKKMVFRGEGPVNVRMKFGDGYETEYFSFLGAEPENTGIAYEVPVGTLGIVQDFPLFPVAVHSDESYERKVNEWSAGEYVSGAIQIRDRESIEEDFLPVLAHEVVHGLNDREFNWDNTHTTYFDEGTGKYVEFLVKRKLYRSEEIDQPPRELFGEETRYRKDGRTYILPPQGDREELWEYYQEEKDFMKEWNAMDTDPETRKFGYAYSELVIRNYVARMNGSLSELYREIDVNAEIEEPGVKWSIYSGYLDMTPCSYSSREKFDRCLDEINSYDYPVYSGKPSRSTRSIEVERLEVPNRTINATPSIDSVKEGEVSFGQFLEDLLVYWARQFGSILQALVASS